MTCTYIVIMPQKLSVLQRGSVRVAEIRETLTELVPLESTEITLFSTKGVITLTHLISYMIIVKIH